MPITVQPVSMDSWTRVGNTFSITATGTSLTYQWYEADKAGVGSDLLLEGETNNTLKVIPESVDETGRTFYCIADSVETPNEKSNVVGFLSIKNGVNAVINGSFDDGSFTGWTQETDPGVLNSSYAVGALGPGLRGGTTASSEYWQEVDVPPDAISYRFSSWVVRAFTDSDYSRTQLRHLDEFDVLIGSQLEVANLNGYNTGDYVKELRETTQVIPANCVKIRIRLRMNRVGGSGTNHAGHDEVKLEFDPVAENFDVDKDPLWEQVASHLSFEDGDGSTTHTDNKGIFTWTNNGTASQSISTSKYGTGSLRLEGGSSNYITTDLGFNLMSNTRYMCIEMDFRIDSFAQWRGLFFQGDSNISGGSADTDRINCGVNTSGLLNCTIIGDDNLQKVRVETPTSFISLNTWYSLAVVKARDTLFLFINGVLIDTDARYTGTPNSKTDFYFGVARASSTVRALLGNIDNCRITTGHYRHVESYTSHLKAFPKIGKDPLQEKVIAHSHFDGTHGSTTIVDTSPNITWSTLGIASLSNVEKRFGDTSLHISNAAGNGALIEGLTDIGTNDFCIECYIKIASSSAGVRYLIDTRPEGDATLAGNIVAFWPTGTDTAGNTLNVQIDGTTVLADSELTKDNNWHHIAITRQSGYVQIFVNGDDNTSSNPSMTSPFGVNIPGSISFDLGRLVVGRDSVNRASSETIIGYIDEFRITNGARRYPVQPDINPRDYMIGLGVDKVYENDFDSYWMYVTTLLRFDEPIGAQYINDEYPLPTWTYYDNGTTEGIAPFGVYTNCFDTINSTNGAYLIGSSLNSIKTQDFTIEMWVKASVNDANDRYLLDGYITNDNDRLSLYSPSSSNKIRCKINGSTVVTSTADVRTGAWVHIAVVRESGNIQLFIDGVGETPVSNSHDIVNSNWTIGVKRSNLTGVTWNGQIDSFRVSIGIARYTNNFTTFSDRLPYIEAPLEDENDIYRNDVISHLTLDDPGVTTFYDNVLNEYWTRTGDSIIENTEPNFGTGTLKVDGAGDSILSPVADDLSLGTDDFTIEFWVRPTTGGAGNNYGRLFQLGDNDTLGSLQIIRANDPNPLQIYVTCHTGVTYVNVVPVTESNLANNTYGHIALTRQGDIWRLFIHGQMVYEGIYAASPETNLTETRGYIGSSNTAGSSFNGYFDEFRITKGVARYTDHFIPRTSPFPISAVATAYDDTSTDVQSATPDRYFYNLVFATSFEPRAIYNDNTEAWEYIGPTSPTGISANYPNNGSYRFLAELPEIVHENGDLTRWTNSLSYSEDYSVQLVPSANDLLYIDGLPHLGFGASGSSCTVQIAAKLESHLENDGDIAALAGEWHSTEQTILWGIERISSELYRFVFRYDSPIFSSGSFVSQGTGTALNDLNSIDIDFDIRKWHLYRLALDTRREKAEIYVDDILFDTITLTAVVGGANMVPDASYGANRTYIASAGPGNEAYTLKGWIDNVRIYSGIAIRDELTTAEASSNISVLPSKYAVPESSASRRQQAVAMAGNSLTTIPNTNDWYPDSDYKIASEKIQQDNSILLGVLFHERDRQESFTSHGDWMGKSAISQVWDEVSGTIIGDPDTGQPPLITNGLSSTTFNAATGQAYLWGARNNPSNKTIFMTIKHDGTAATRTLIASGDLYDLSHINYIVELTSTHEIKVRLVDLVGTSWVETTTTAQVPTDTTTPIVIEMGVSEPSAASSVIIVKIGTNVSEEVTISGTTTSTVATVISNIVSIGGAFDSGVDYSISNDELDQSKLHFGSATISNSAQGVTFEELFINGKTWRSDAPYTTFEVMASAYVNAVNDNLYVDYSTTLDPRLISDIRLQGYADSGYTQDLTNKQDWLVSNAVSDNEYYLSGTLSSLRLKAGLPVVSGGSIECLETNNILSEIADNAFSIELQALIRERGYSDSFGDSSDSSTVADEWRKCWFGLVDTVSGSRTSSTDRTPPFAICANGVQSDGNLSGQLYMRLYDLDGTELVNENDPAATAGLERAPYKAEEWHHIAFSREIVNGLDSVYRLFLDGELIQEVTLVNKIIDYSTLSTDYVFRYGVPWETTDILDSSPWLYMSYAKIWNYAKFITNFEPDTFADNSEAFSVEGDLTTVSRSFCVGDRWIDTDEGDKEYVWDGTEWVPATEYSVVVP